MIIDFNKYDQQKPNEKNSNKWSPVSYYARTAAVIGGLIFVAVLAVLAAVVAMYLAWFDFNVKTLVTIILIGLTIAIVLAVAVTAAMGIRWTTNNVART